MKRRVYSPRSRLIACVRACGRRRFVKYKKRETRAAAEVPADRGNAGDQIPKSGRGSGVTLRDTRGLSTTHVNFNALDAIAVLLGLPSRHVSVEFLVILVPRHGVKLVLS